MLAPNMPEAHLTLWGGEEDMLDLAYDIQRTSRLGCRIALTEALDGLVVRLPKDVRNMLL